MNALYELLTSFLNMIYNGHVCVYVYMFILN